jgi:hypothetical protein
VAAPFGSAATTIPAADVPAASASVRASVATSVELFASEPSAPTSAMTQIAPFAPAAAIR